MSHDHSTLEETPGIWFTYFGKGGAAAFAFLWVITAIIWIISVLNWG